MNAFTKPELYVLSTMRGKQLFSLPDAHSVKPIYPVDSEAESETNGVRRRLQLLTVFSLSNLEGLLFSLEKQDRSLF